MTGKRDLRRLPRPVAETWEWQLQGNCRSDPDAMFVPEGMRNPRKAEHEARAKEICRTCPVLDICRDWALRTREPFGVWGGLTEGERDTILRGPGRITKAAYESAPVRRGVERG